VGDVADRQGQVHHVDDRQIHSKEHITRSHGFRFRGQYEEEIKKDLEQGGIEITAGIPGENAAGKK